MAFGFGGECAAQVLAQARGIGDALPCPCLTFPRITIASSILLGCNHRVPRTSNTNA
jgi:hypothetical protein